MYLLWSEGFLEAVAGWTEVIVEALKYLNIKFRIRIDHNRYLPKRSYKTKLTYVNIVKCTVKIHEFGN